MRCFIKILIYVVAFTNCALSYNIDVRKEAIRYLLSPLQQKLYNRTLKRANGLNENRRGPEATKEEVEPGPLPSSQASAFFGYDFNIYPSVTGYGVLVGAPKTDQYSNPFAQGNATSYSTTGDVQNCPIQDIFSSSHPPSCPTAIPRTAKSGDAFGISLGVSPSGRLTACSPPRKQNCTNTVYSPGYCYNQDEGKRWEPDPYTKRLECPSFALDMMFVLDGSGSVGKSNFDVVKNWVKKVAENFNIQDGSSRIGVIQYSHLFETRPLDKQPYIRTEIELGEYDDHSELFAAIDNISLSGYTTYTAHALNKSVLDFMSSDRFNDSAKVLILLTDGQSSDKFELPESAAYVRSLGIRTFAVGVGDADVSELKTVATGTASDKNVYYVSNFDQLAQIVSQLKTAILTFVLEGSQSSSTAALTFQVAETGFSIHSSNKREEGTSTPVR